MDSGVCMKGRNDGDDCMNLGWRGWRRGERDLRYEGVTEGDALSSFMCPELCLKQ
jgi:hypothetical protein